MPNPIIPLNEPTPVPFLTKSNDFSKPAVVSEDPKWSGIFSAENFTNVASPPLSTANADGDVTLTVALTAGDDFFGALQFSSALNESYFGLDPSQDALHNRAWIGDSSNSAVMTLSPAAAQTPAAQRFFASTTSNSTSVPARSIPLAQGDDSVWKAFGISSDDNAQLKDFMTGIESSLGPLKVTLNNATTANSPNPNAVWCFTSPVAYQTTVKLEFEIAISQAGGQSPVTLAISWITRNLGLTLGPALNLATMFITAIKTTTYDRDALNPKQEWTVSFMLEIMSFRFALDFSNSNNTKFYLVPDSNFVDIGIVPDLLEAFSALPGLDPDEMPTVSGDSLFSELIGKNLNLWYVQLSTNTSSTPTTSTLTTSTPTTSTPTTSTTTTTSTTPLASTATVATTSTTPTLSWGVGLLAGTTTRSGIPVLLGLTYASDKKAFAGRLILSTDPLFTNLRYPDYDYRLALPTLTYLDISTIGPNLNLWDLFTGLGSPPSELAIPLLLTAADVTYQTLSNGATVTFSMDISSNAGPAPPSDGTTSPAPSCFSWDEISVSCSTTATKTEGTTKKTTAIQIYSGVIINPRTQTTPAIPSATLPVTLSYNNSVAESTWTLHGKLSSLSVDLLADVFFDTACNTGALAVLGYLTITDLDVRYTYSSAGEASSFLISAVISLGDLSLDLSYQYVSSKHGTAPTAADLKWGDTPPYAELSKIKPQSTNAWAFEAFLQVSSQSSTIASVVNSIVPTKGDALPDFVGGIVIAAKGDPLNAPIKLIYTGDDVNGSILAVWVNIGPFNMTFIQYRPKPTDGHPAPGVKQILRISADQIPMLDKVPLVNQLPQPFDHLIYMWVGDPDQTDANLKGFTRDSIDPGIGGAKAINGALAEISIPPIQLQDSSSTTATDLVLQAGHHFMVIADNKLVLDHIFTPDPKPASSTPAKSSETNATPKSSTTKSTDGTGVVNPGTVVTTPSDSSTTPESPATKGNTNKTAGPLTISAITLQYKNGSLFIGLNATLVLGPLTFSVIGFTISIEISQVKLNNLAAIITNGLISVSLNGLEAAVDKDPLTLAGVFIHDITQDASGDITTDSYRGGIAVGFEAWKVLAVGEYAIVSSKSQNSEFKSVFVYGKLDGPLIELEFATISGVRLGFGYNSMVTLPTADQLYQFPFISDSAGGDDPLAVINAMEKGTPAFVFPKLGSTWFAAGMTITCFDCITLTAVLMFEIETSSAQNGVIIALLADGIFQMEPLAPPDLSLFYVELLIKVELNFIEGYIAADAALAPSSHVYVPSAHLTGMGSFYSWFPPNSHAGDWVVTIGGYHRAYNPPSHYPQNLARLGLNFVVGDNVHVVGAAYVAVTPKCAMAGGTLHISVDVGPVSAYADIALDVFINFKPFYFIAQISLSVGVDCEVDLLFVSFHVSLTLSADLTLWGPDSFGGTAYVDFWFFGFSIDFGDGLRGPPGIPLIEFYEMVRTAGPNSTPPPSDTTSASNPYQAQHKYSIENGLFPQKPTPSAGGGIPNTGANTEWIVLAGPLQIRIDCDMSLSSAFLTTSTGNIPIQPDLVLNPIYAFPMHNTEPIISVLGISVFFLEDASNPELIDGFQAELVIKNAPLATWSRYTTSNDPLALISGRVNKPTTLQDGSNPTVQLCQGVRLYPPIAVLSQSPVVDFDATAAMLSSDDVPFVPPSPPQAAFLCSPFEPTLDPVTQWADFSATLAGTKNASTTDASGNTFLKADVRGDALGAGTGMLGLLVQSLGWAQRSAQETVGGVVPDVLVPDPANLGKTVVQRKEWELVGSEPTVLSDELAYYYPYLPMVTAAA